VHHGKTQSPINIKTAATYAAGAEELNLEMNYVDNVMVRLRPRTWAARSLLASRP
jgi:carbonic anhydrase